MSKAGKQRRPVIFLPGSMLDGCSFAHQLEALSGDYSVVGADLTRDTSIADLAGKVLSEAGEQFALVGLSMVGIVALEIWAQAPGRVTHLALLDTTFHADRPEGRAVRLEQMSQVDSGALREVTQSLLPLYLARQHLQHPDLTQAVLDTALEPGPEVFKRQSVALRDRIDRSDILPTINCPTLVLCGQEHRLCPPAVHSVMASQIPDADLVVLADCGHLSTMERPEAVSQELGRLLQRTS